jgi:hypothetical protein
VATYTQYFPGPSASEEYTSLDAAWEDFIFRIAPEFVGAIGASGSLTWYPVALSNTGGGQPHWAIQWNSTTGGHLGIMYIRWSPTLLGTADPSYFLGADATVPNTLFSAWTYADLAQWITRAGGTTVITGIFGSQLAAIIQQAAANPASLTGSATMLQYTDGARTGGYAGIRTIYTYNPTPGEITAGVKQLVHARQGAVSDADDGTINIVSGGGLIGGAVSQVPIVQFESDASADAWNFYVNQQTENWSDYSITSVNIVTNNGDLGQPSAPATEPNPGDVSVQVFASPGVLPAIIGGTTDVATVTTFPGQILAAVALVGKLAQVARPIVDEAVSRAIDIVSAPKRIADALEAISSSLEAIAEDVSVMRTQYAPNDPATPLADTFYDRLDKVREQLANVAQTRSVLTVKTHGHEWQAETGAMIEEP